MALFKNKEDQLTLLKKELKEYWDESQTYLKPRHEKWKKLFNYWQNQQVSDSRPSFLSDTTVNYCWVITSVKLPILTASKPTVTFIALDNDENKELRAESMTKIIGNALWNKLRVQRKLQDALLSAMIYDIGWLKTGWSANNDDLFVTAVDPFKVFVDPLASSIETARYIIHAEPYALSTLKKRFPKFKEVIKADPEISDILFEDRKGGGMGDGPTSGVVSENTKFKTERALLKEYWISPDECDQSVLEVVDTREEVKQIPLTDENGQPIVSMEGYPMTTTSVEVIEIKKPKWRNGRIITQIGNVIVEDKPNPYTHGEFPFTPVIMSPRPNELYGMGDLEQIQSLQDALNHAYQQVDDLASTTQNPTYILDPSLGEKQINDIINALGEPGASIIAPPEKIKQLNPPPIPYTLMNRITDLVNRLRDVSGISDVLQGAHVTHRTARGIERLHEASASRLRTSDQLKEESLKRMAYQMASIVQQFYTEEKTLALIGTTGTATETMTFRPEDIKGHFEVSIDSGVTLPKDKQSRADLAFNLYQNQILDAALAADPALRKKAEYMMNLLEVPGREQLLNFAEEQMQAQQKAQAEGQGQQPNLPPEVAELTQTLGVASPQELLQQLMGGQAPPPTDQSM